MTGQWRGPKDRSAMTDEEAARFIRVSEMQRAHAIRLEARRAAQAAKDAAA